MLYTFHLSLTHTHIYTPLLPASALARTGCQEVEFIDPTGTKVRHLKNQMGLLLCIKPKAFAFILYFSVFTVGL